MRTLIGWTVGAACVTVIVTGFSALPAQAQTVRNDVQDLRQDNRDVRQDRRDIRQDNRDIRTDKQDIAKDTQDVHQDRKDLQGARQQLRDAYKSGDPNAIKAARENFQKTRGELKGDLKERRTDERDLHKDRQDRRASSGSSRARP